MTDDNYERKLAELDDLINDTGLPLCAARIWQLLGEISGHVSQVTSMELESWPVAAE